MQILRKEEMRIENKVQTGIVMVQNIKHDIVGREDRGNVRKDQSERAKSFQLVVAGHSDQILSFFRNTNTRCEINDTG